MFSSPSFWDPDVHSLPSTLTVWFQMYLTGAASTLCTGQSLPACHSTVQVGVPLSARRGILWA